MPIFICNSYGAAVSPGGLIRMTKKMNYVIKEQGVPEGHLEEPSRLDSQRSDPEIRERTLQR
eukprot:9618106-Prorocentrum_lima.AAC.1